MSIIFSLWLLGTLDSAFSGFRAAAGRNALIDKRAYYIRSLLIGAAYGQAMMAVIAAAVLWFSSTDDWFWSTAVRAAGRFEMLLWPFAGLVLLALVVRLIPSIDLKCISSVVVFGPCVLIRPVVVIVGALYGLWGAMADWWMAS